jgi:hypothetical protein
VPRVASENAQGTIEHCHEAIKLLVGGGCELLCRRPMSGMSTMFEVFDPPALGRRATGIDEANRLRVQAGGGKPASRQTLEGAPTGVPAVAAIGVVSTVKIRRHGELLQRLLRCEYDWQW